LLLLLSFLNVASGIRQRVDGSQRVNTVDEKITTAFKNLVNFGQGTLPWQPFLWRVSATSSHTSPLLFVLASDGNIATPIVALTSTKI